MEYAGRSAVPVQSLADDDEVRLRFHRPDAPPLCFVRPVIKYEQAIPRRAKRGQDLEMKEGTLVIKYRRKGGKFTAREVSDPAACEALDAYLEAAGRRNVLGSERPLWTRHDQAGRPGAPLSSRSFAENLKVYAKEAGIEHIHVHQTRHTYARIVAEETGSFIETQEALDHENAATTRVYVQRIMVKKDRHGSKVSARIRK